MGMAEMPELTENREGLWEGVKQEVGGQVQEGRRRQKWTEEETNDLLRGILTYGCGNWKKILVDRRFNFANRSPIDLKDRFRTVFPEDYRRLYPNARTHANRGQKTPKHIEIEKVCRKERQAFTPEEDVRLMEGFRTHGASWSKIQKDPRLGFSTRRSTDLRDRFRNAFPDRYAAAGFKPRPPRPGCTSRSTSSESTLSIGPGPGPCPNPDFKPEDPLGLGLQMTYPEPPQEDSAALGMDLQIAYPIAKPPVSAALPTPPSSIEMRLDFGTQNMAPAPYKQETSSVLHSPPSERVLVTPDLPQWTRPQGMGCGLGESTQGMGTQHQHQHPIDRLFTPTGFLTPHSQPSYSPTTLEFRAEQLQMSEVSMGPDGFCGGLSDCFFASSDHNSTPGIGVEIGVGGDVVTPSGLLQAKVVPGQDAELLWGQIMPVQVPGVPIQYAAPGSGLGMHVDGQFMAVFERGDGTGMGQ
ncbi:hypothetical protein YB2330_005771 [Saitoella coloradoensis]